MPKGHTQTITAPDHRALAIEVFEPRQHQGDDEPILDRFTLEPGESRDYQMPTDTAAYRIAGAKEKVVHPDQEGEGELHPAAQSELEAGTERHKLNNPEGSKSKAKASSRAKHKGAAETKQPGGDT